MSTQRALVVPPDPRWPGMFHEEAECLRHALGAAAVALHHIGSTAIPGVHAKPIIDILIEATSPTDIESRNPAMEGIGYEPMGEFGLPGRRYFRKGNPAGVRTHHAHAYAVGHPDIARHLAFRDFMTAHPDWAKRYSDLKRELAAAHPGDIEAYMDGKDPFIQDAERQAMAWQAGRAR